jgi:hypothetical protein
MSIVFLGGFRSCLADARRSENPLRSGLKRAGSQGRHDVLATEAESAAGISQRERRAANAAGPWRDQASAVASPRNLVMA